MLLLLADPDNSLLTSSLEESVLSSIEWSGLFRDKPAVAEAEVEADVEADVEVLLFSSSALRPKGVVLEPTLGADSEAEAAAVVVLAEPRTGAAAAASAAAGAGA